MRTDYEPINYYDNPPNDITGTMQYLHWFRFFLRNSDDYIRTTASEHTSKFPNDSIRLFFIMRSSEATHIPATYTITSKTPLTYEQWGDLIAPLQIPIEIQVERVLQKEVRAYLDWKVAEFIGWTTDRLVQNPEENKQAFRFEGHLTSTLD